MTTDAAVAQAQAILNRHRDLQRAADVREKKSLIGKCFRYRNTFGDGKHWWLYTVVTSVNRWGHLHGLSFQTKSDGSTEIEPRNYLSLSGWKEISRQEFDRAKAQCIRRIVKQLKAERP